MDKKIVMVTGLPRTGINLVARIVELLGYPGPDPAANPCDKRVSPVGRLADPELLSGKVEREPPWVFATHGPLDAAAGERLLALPDLAVIECRRDGGAILESLGRCMAAVLPDLGEGQLPKLVDRHYRIWKHRLQFFLPRWEGPRLVVSLNGLAEKPRRTVRRIAAFVGTDPSDKAIKFVNPKLVRAGR